MSHLVNNIPSSKSLYAFSQYFWRTINFFPLSTYGLLLLFYNHILQAWSFTPFQLQRAHANSIAVYVFLPLVYQLQCFSMNPGPVPFLSTLTVAPHFPLNSRPIFNCQMVSGPGCYPTQQCFSIDLISLFYFLLFTLITLSTVGLLRGCSKLWINLNKMW